MIVDDNHREIRGSGPLHYASEACYTFRKRHSQYLKPLLFQKLRHVGNGINPQFPVAPYVIGKLLGFVNVMEFAAFGDWALPDAPIALKHLLDLKVPPYPSDHLRFT